MSEIKSRNIEVSAVIAASMNWAPVAGGEGAGSASSPMAGLAMALRVAVAGRSKG